MSHLLGASNELLSGLRCDLRGLLCHLCARHIYVSICSGAVLRIRTLLVNIHTSLLTASDGGRRAGSRHCLCKPVATRVQLVADLPCGVGEHLGGLVGVVVHVQRGLVALILHEIRQLLTTSTGLQ